jgi:hypothetical protein
VLKRLRVEPSYHVTGQFSVAPSLHTSNNSVTPCTRCHRIHWVDYGRRYLSALSYASDPFTLPIHSLLPHLELRMDSVAVYPSPHYICGPDRDHKELWLRKLEPMASYHPWCQPYLLLTLDTQGKLLFVTPTTIIAPYDIRQDRRNSVYLHP